MPKRHWRNTGFEAGFTAPAGHMRMAVDKSGYQRGSVQVVFCRACGHQLALLVADTKDPATANQDVTNSEVFRREDSGVCEQF